MCMQTQSVGLTPCSLWPSGIFAFKCSRAEEIFNMLQEVMHSHSISVVEEAVLEPSQQAALTPAGTRLHTYQRQDVCTCFVLLTRSQHSVCPSCSSGLLRTDGTQRSDPDPVCGRHPVSPLHPSPVGGQHPPALRGGGVYAPSAGG